MDLLSFTRTLWHHRWWSLPLVAVAIASVVYVGLAADRTYEARADLVLIGPPGPPTAAELESNPDLVGADLDNPYARVFDPTVITEIVARVVAVDRVNGEVPSGYRIETARRYGSAAPLVEISARASDPDVAAANARAVSNQFVAALQDLQAAEQVHPRSLITTRTVDDAENPREVLTQRLRAVVGVGAVGLVAIIVLVTMAQALAERPGRRHPDQTGELRSSKSPSLDPGSPGPRDADLAPPMSAPR
jgi:uncharacterized protein involved in exopolysaccharide biosynthesis